MPEETRSILEKLQDHSSDDVMNTIYEQVNSLLGTGNQLFAMEFPARPLNGKTYEYNTDDCFSRLTKPYPVQEAEFLLSDELFDVSPVVQGANGDKLSTVYDTVINNFVPKLGALKNFVHDQKNLRKWLLEKVEEVIDGKSVRMSRMEMAKTLYGTYLEMRNTWYKEKNSKYDSYKEKGDLDGYSRWLSSEGLVREEEINNFYNDAIVRGYYHEVLTLLGFLNVSSPSEVLEHTKQKMRASLRRSLDGSSDIYPVEFQPSDWFKALKPNLRPKDLIMSTDSLLAEYRAKKKLMSSLQASLNDLNVIEISPEEQEELQHRIDDAQKKVDETEQKIIKTYGSGALSAFKAVLSIYKEKKDAVANAIEAISQVKNKNVGELVNESQKKIYTLLEDVAADVIEGVGKTYQQQGENIQALKQLTDTMMNYAESRSKDMRLQKQRVQEQIAAVQADLDFLTPLVTGSISEFNKLEEEGKIKTDNGNVIVPDEPLMTGAIDDGEDNSFMDVLIKSDEAGSFSSADSSSSASFSSWRLGGWFWSAGREKSSSSSISEEEKKEINKKMEIGFRVKKVSFQRGGWFNTSLLKLSSNYYKLSDMRFSGGLNKEAVRQGIAQARSGKTLDDMVTYLDENTQKKNKYMLPAFPTGFVIAKDITIRIQSSVNESKLMNSYMKNNESSSGGIFCFRGSSSKSNSSSNQSSYFGHSENYFYIRIPGPQILGWFLEFTPMDNSDSYQELDPELYTDTLEQLVPEEKKEDKKEQEVT